MCRRPRAATAFSAWRWSMALVDPGEGAVTYQRQPAKAAPEVLARPHMPLVRKIAWHVHGPVSSAMEVEDPIQVGMVALREAANGLADCGHACSTHAPIPIRRPMIPSLSPHSTTPRPAPAPPP